jgi:hypothetical protein
MLEFFFSLNVRAGVPMNALTDSLRGNFGFSLVFDITFCQAFSKTDKIDFDNHVSGMHQKFTDAFPYFRYLKFKMESLQGIVSLDKGCPACPRVGVLLFSAN